MDAKSILHMIIPELEFKYFTASGPGGQNLQKNKTGVQLFWNIDTSTLNDELKAKLRRVNRSTKEGFIVQFKSQTDRSLDLNKKSAINKLLKLIEAALFVPKERRATKPTRGSVKRRLNEKKEHKDRKSSRRANKVGEW